MKQTIILPKVIKFAKQFYPKDSIHNWNHTIKVVKNIKKISKNSDLIIAGYLHDIGYLQNNPKNRDMSKYKELQKKHKTISAHLAKEFLEKQGCSKQKIDFICEIIKHHGIESAKNSKFIESKQLCDADKMTQIGFGGIHIIKKRMQFRKESFNTALKKASEKNYSLYNTLFTKKAKETMRFEFTIAKFIYKLLL